MSLGYAGSPLWATGNLSKNSGKIVDPLAAGELFMYGKTTVYNSSDSRYAGEEDPLDINQDAAHSVNDKWRIPTHAQFEALLANTTTQWEEDWTALGTKKGGRLITSKVNGISVFFAAAGHYEAGYPDPKFVGNAGFYWSSTPNGASDALTLFFKDVEIRNSGTARLDGYSIRPVKN